MSGSEEDIYEILAAFFVNIIYNKLYPLADEYKISGKFPTRTDAYRYVVRGYLNNIAEKPQNGRSKSNTVIKELCEYYNTKKSVNFLQDNVINIYTDVFITQDFRRNFDMKSRIALLRKIIQISLTEFIKEILEPKFLNKIIDKNDTINTSNTRLCQNMLVAKFKEVKQTYIYKFDKALIETNNKDKTRINEIKALVTDMSKLQIECKRKDDHIAQLKDAYKQLRGKYEMLEAKYESLKNEQATQRETKVLTEQDYTVGDNTIEQAIEKLAIVAADESADESTKGESEDEIEDSIIERKPRRERKKIVVDR